MNNQKDLVLGKSSRKSIFDGSIGVKNYLKRNLAVGVYWHGQFQQDQFSTNDYSSESSWTFG